MAFVYILAHRSGARFKIGKALKVVSRIKAFGLATLDLQRSEVLSVANGADAYNLERALHRTFRRWRIPAEKILAQGGAEDGASEWFGSECTERLNRFLAQNHDLFRFSRRPLEDFADLAAWLQCGDTEEERRTVLNLAGPQCDAQPGWDEDWVEDFNQEPACSGEAHKAPSVSPGADLKPIGDFGKKRLAAERFVGRSLLTRLRALCTTLVLLPEKDVQPVSPTRTLCGVFEADHRTELDALLVELESEYRPFHFIEGVFSASDYELRQRITCGPEARLTYASLAVVLRWPAPSSAERGLAPSPYSRDPVEESLREVTRWELGIPGWDLPLTLTPRELVELREKAITDLSPVAISSLYLKG